MNVINFKKNQEKSYDGTIFGLILPKTTTMSNAILTEIPEKLPISEELRNFMITNNYPNLGELIKEGTPKLQRTKGWNVMCFESLLDLLDQYNIMHLLAEGDE